MIWIMYSILRTIYGHAWEFILLRILYTYNSQSTHTRATMSQDLIVYWPTIPRMSISTVVLNHQFELIIDHAPTHSCMVGDDRRHPLTVNLCDQHSIFHGLCVEEVDHNSSTFEHMLLHTIMIWYLSNSASWPVNQWPH